MTSKACIGTNTPDLTYVPRAIHCPLNLPHCRPVCQSLSLLRSRPAQCGLMFVRFCTGERNSVTRHHGLRLPNAHFMTVGVGWFVRSCGTILSAQPLPNLRPSDVTEQNFQKKISIQNFISNYISTFRRRISALMKICALVGFCAAWDGSLLQVPYWGV